MTAKQYAKSVLSLYTCEVCGSDKINPKCTACAAFAIEMQYDFLQELSMEKEYEEASQNYVSNFGDDDEY